MHEQQQHDSTQQQQQAEQQPPPPPQPTLRQLSAQDCVDVVNQLGAIARSRSTSSSSVGGSGSTANPFAEDQALQHSLALVSRAAALRLACGKLELLKQALLTKLSRGGGVLGCQH